VLIEVDVALLEPAHLDRPQSLLAHEQHHQLRSLVRAALEQHGDVLRRDSTGEPARNPRCSDAKSGVGRQIPIDNGPLEEVSQRAETEPDRSGGDVHVLNPVLDVASSDRRYGLVRAEEPDEQSEDLPESGRRPWRDLLSANPARQVVEADLFQGISGMRSGVMAASTSRAVGSTA